MGITLDREWLYRILSERIESKYDKATFITLLILEPEIIKLLILENISGDNLDELVDGFKEYVMSQIQFTEQEVTEFVDNLAKKIWEISQNGYCK